MSSTDVAMEEKLSEEMFHGFKPVQSTKLKPRVHLPDLDITPVDSIAVPIVVK